MCACSKYEAGVKDPDAYDEYMEVLEETWEKFDTNREKLQEELGYGLIK